MTAFDSPLTATAFLHADAPFQLRGINIEGATVDAGKTLSNYTSLYIGSSGGAGTVTSKYALVTEPGAGNVGIGTTTPGSPLTVAGVIQSTSGGFKFPDGTIQASAAASVSSIADVTGTAPIAVTSPATNTRNVVLNPISDANVTTGANIAPSKIAGTAATLGAPSNTFTGSITAASFTGSGAGLTNLNGGSLTGVVPIVNGGTGISTGPTASGQFLRGSGPGSWSVAPLSVSDIPTLPYVDLISNQTVGGVKMFTGSVGAASITIAPPGTLSTPSITLTSSGGNIVSSAGPINISATSLSANTSGSVFINDTSAVGITLKGGGPTGSTFSLSGNGAVVGATGTATTSTGFNSAPLGLTASSFNSGTAAAVPQNFLWQAEPLGNNTASPGGSLNLLFAAGSNTPAETGLSIASTGKITFAAGQNFPGTGSGTVTAVSGTAPVTVANPTTTPNVSLAPGGITNALLANPSLTVTAGTGLGGGGSVALGGSTSLSVANGGITNAMLQNSGLTISSGSGLSGGGAVNLGGTLTLSNTGLLGLTASAPLAATAGQNPVISLTGIVPVANGGTGSNTQNFVDLTSNQSIAGSKTFTGTASFTGAGSFAGLLTGSGGLALPATGTATTGGGFKSNSSDLTASVFNSTASAAQAETFRWQAEPAGNNTPTPSGTLNLLFSGTSNSFTPTETGLSVASGGQITFAAGQSFPGSVSSVSAGDSSITVGGTASAPTVAVATGGVTAAKIAAGAVVKSLNAQTDAVTVAGTNGLSVSAGTGTVTVSSNATPANTASTLVSRDASGNFAAGTITASLSGNAATATTATNALALGGNAASAYSTTAQSDLRYLQLTGGTLTGGLSGTSASFTGAGSFTGLLTGSGGLTLPATGTATAVGGFNSNTQGLVASAFNSTASAAQAETFRWQAEPAGNNTPTPSGTLNLLFSGTSNSFTPTETGLSVASNGQITFAAGQSFPGAGTVTSITAGTGLTGGTISTSGTIAINPAVVPQLAAANTFTAQDIFTAVPSGTGVNQGSVYINPASATAGQTLLGAAVGGTQKMLLDSGGNLTLAGTLGLPATTNATTGVITLGGNRFLHSFGSFNTFLGANAGNFNSLNTGNSNTASGAFALNSNTAGSSNTASGAFALQLNTTGNNNTAGGAGALVSNTGNNNTASGAGALSGNTTGNSNTASGGFALNNNTAGANNTAVGFGAGVTGNAVNANTTGSNNTFIGFNAGPGVASANALTNATAIGANALVSASNSMVLGDGTVNVGIGTQAPAARLDVAGGSIRTDSQLISTATIGAPLSVASTTLVPNLNAQLHNGLASTQLARVDVGNNFTGNQSVTGNLSLAGTLALPVVGVVTFGGTSFLHNFGTNNTFVGASAGAGNVTSLTGSANTGAGTLALFSNTTGSNNSAFGTSALLFNTTGGANSAFGSGALQANTTGANNNSAFGFNALQANTTAGRNSAFGSAALNANTTGSDNSAFGFNALLSNTTAGANSAFGSGALQANTTGANDNSAFGFNALNASTTGSSNSAFGSIALANLVTGGGNIAVGTGAGLFLVTGSSNIYIGSLGASSESNTIRIGSQAQAATFIAGISGATSASGVAVLVNAFGQLGTTTSSRKFKEEIADMGGESDLLMKLRPVAFYYKPELDETHTRQYGLVAEEVAQVAPQLVVFDKDGAPQTVRYHFVNAMLLNEVQKQRRLVEEQRSTIARQQAEIQDLAARLAKLEALLAAGR